MNYSTPLIQSIWLFVQVTKTSQRGLIEINKDGRDYTIIELKKLMFYTNILLTKIQFQKNFKKVIKINCNTQKSQPTVNLSFG